MSKVRGGEVPLAVVGVGKEGVDTISDLDNEGVELVHGLEWGKEIRDLELVGSSSDPSSGGLEDDSGAEGVGGDLLKGLGLLDLVDDGDPGDIELSEASSAVEDGSPRSGELNCKERTSSGEGRVGVISNNDDGSQLGLVSKQVAGETELGDLETLGIGVEGGDGRWGLSDLLVLGHGTSDIAGFGDSELEVVASGGVESVDSLDPQVEFLGNEDLSNSGRPDLKGPIPSDHAEDVFPSIRSLDLQVDLPDLALEAVTDVVSVVGREGKESVLLDGPELVGTEGNGEDHFGAVKVVLELCGLVCELR